MLSQGEVNARMLPWGDVEFRRFDFRMALFQRRGMPEADAERTADRLALRDQEKDDRRLCMECRHILREMRCPKREAALRDVFQRCPKFDFEKPSP